MKIWLILTCFNLIALGVSAQSLRLNESKILASHNSYKKLPHKKVIRFLSKFKKQLGPSNDPIQLDYGHKTLPEQFDTFNIRGIELDLYYDPIGGHYKKRKLNLFLFGLKQRVRDPRMKSPGFKVLHIADVDYETQYLTFKDALIELRTWSEKNPAHHPIFVNIEPKSTSPGNESKTLRKLGFKPCVPYDQKAFLEMENEITGILPANKIFTPSDLKGDFSTIHERLTETGWPELNQCLGKFIFILDGKETLYKSATTTPIMFYYASPQDPDAAFVVMNDPVGNEEKIQHLTSTYIVRTRSDAGTLQSRNNDYSTYNAAIRSGAQIISTDYYAPDLRWSTFQIKR
ncbi:MAG: Ca2+-dependent phosphoinositide-specific phospholipase C [Crocinitomicaceae bacterium]